MQTRISSKSKEVVIGPGEPVVMIGERINPTGRKKLAESLEKGDMRLVQAEALTQVAAGAQVLDVNMGASGTDEKALMIEALAALAEITDVPLCIDSAKPDVLAAGLEVYQGKALVNSVNGEEAKLKEVLPLVAQHKAAAVGLTMDDNGIPLEDIVIDPLAMAVASSDKAGMSALQALQEVRSKFGVNQTIGASNVSFGLPDRPFINSVFLSMAMICGLTCPITDPTVCVVREALLISDLMLGKDEFAMNFITTYCEQHPD